MSNKGFCNQFLGNDQKSCVEKEKIDKEKCFFWEKKTEEGKMCNILFSPMSCYNQKVMKNATAKTK
jgi:hypothetical protein